MNTLNWELALSKLKEGNKRFVQQELINSNHTSTELKMFSEGQYPFAIVIACSDSRVSPDIIFDTKLGELFIIQNAGNIVDETVLGSIEYAVSELGCSIVVVMGHNSCGAISATFNHSTPTGNLKSIINYIDEYLVDCQSTEDLCKMNIVGGAKLINNNTIVKKHNVKVFEVCYQIDTGLIYWLD